MFLSELLEGRNNSAFIVIGGRPWHVYGVASERDFHRKLAREVTVSYTDYPGRYRDSNSPSYLQNMSPTEFMEEVMRYLSDMSRAHDDFYEIPPTQNAKEITFDDIQGELIDDIIHQVTHESDY